MQKGYSNVIKVYKSEAKPRIKECYQDREKRKKTRETFTSYRRLRKP